MPTKHFIDGVSKIHSILIDCPDALDIALLKTEAGHKYAYVNPSKEARKVRKDAQIILWEVWQGGAYSYAELAKAIRIDELALKGALEPDWRAEVGLE